MIPNQTKKQSSALELWGGVECTINRVSDQYFEQLGRSGHTSRLADFERFAALGVKAVRQPVLWESIAPDPHLPAQWDWSDAALAKLAEVGIRPIIGLIHHGSGPAHTHLLDPTFPEKLSKYAAMVAERYPWVDEYTPVNAPLPTARFSALYGHWYPQRRDELSFSRALMNQCKAVILSMEAIRRINPSAKLIQTDDLSKTFSTPRLAYQAEFENERRWVSYDLLCGKVDRNHRMWHHFRWAGVDESELLWFLDHPCPPHVIGINHYLSGNRYLDEHLERYPAESHGGNGRDRYADVLAPRVLASGAVNVCQLILEAWNRFLLPIAITECHNGCTREEQLRWLQEVWKSAEAARSDGADVLAVTAWSLLGAFDWNHLVTQRHDHYEPGVYDVRSLPPRPTALVEVITQLAAGRECDHPVLDAPGWWHRSQRFLYGFSLDDMGELQKPVADNLPSGPPILITGAGSMVGRAFARICESRGIAYRAFTRQECDITNPVSLHKALFKVQPWAIVNAAGYHRVDDAEANPQRCSRINTEAAHLLARECAERGIKLLTFSSDLVFDGTKNHPYVESDAPVPLNQYGCSKARAERSVVASFASALIVRTGPIFSAWDQRHFLSRALHALRNDQPFRALGDMIVSPTYLPDLVHASLDLLIDYESGIWHLANVGQTSWAELAQEAARLADVPTRTLEVCDLRDLNLPARRPAFAALTSERAVLLPTLQDALARFVMDSQNSWMPVDTPSATTRTIAA